MILQSYQWAHETNKQIISNQIKTDLMQIQSYWPIYLGSFWRTPVWHIQLWPGMALADPHTCRLWDTTNIHNKLSLRYNTRDTNSKIGNIWRKWKMNWYDIVHLPWNIELFAPFCHLMWSTFSLNCPVQCTEYPTTITEFTWLPQFILFGGASRFSSNTIANAIWMNCK